jgi:hypothetical protein
VDRQPAVLHVRDGELVEEGSWVYVWLRPVDERRVIYVGGTGLPPAARTWLHLHSEDPKIARIAFGYPAAGGDLNEPLEVRAFRVPDGVPRRAVRDVLIARLAAAGELSPLYCGFPRVETDGPAEVAAVADVVIAGLRLPQQRPDRPRD